MFMTRDELVEMTGARRSSSICQWLKDQKLPFRLGRDNWPRVLRSVKRTPRSIGSTGARVGARGTPAGETP